MRQHGAKITLHVQKKGAFTRLFYLHHQYYYTTQSGMIHA